MQPHINVLTGHQLFAPGFREFLEKNSLKHPIWVNRDDVRPLKDLHLLARQITLDDTAEAVEIDGHFLGKPMSFFNIAHFSHPFTLFDYLLNRRQFSENGGAFGFQDQVILHKHARYHGFTERYWVTKNQLVRRSLGALRVKDDATGIQLTSRRRRFDPDDCSFVYNVEETNDPSEVKRRIFSRCSSVFTGQLFAAEVQNPMLDKAKTEKYCLPLWFMKSQLRDLERSGVRLNESAQPVVVRHPQKGIQRFFNIEQSNDPLALQKKYYEAKNLNFMFLDLLTGKGFSVVDAKSLLQAKHESQYWIEKEKLHCVGATLSAGEENNYVKCFSGCWYNMDQIENKADVIKYVCQKRGRISPQRQEMTSMDILEKILGHGSDITST